MPNIKKIQNLDLITGISSSGTIEIIELTEDNLKDIGWLDENNWPTKVFSQVISDINTISPSEFQHGAKFFDQIIRGFSIYNQVLEKGEND